MTCHPTEAGIPGTSRAVDPCASCRTWRRRRTKWDLILWIIAAIIGIIGVIRLFQKQILWGIVLIVVALLIGPGGVSLFT